MSAYTKKMGAEVCPIQKWAIFLLSKAAQGFMPRRTFCTSQAKTRGERRSVEKWPFLDGH